VELLILILVLIVIFAALGLLKVAVWALSGPVIVLLLIVLLVLALTGRL